MSNKSKYFEIEQESGGFIVYNQVTGMPYYEGSDGMDCDNKVKIFTSFASALECGQMIARRYASIQRGY